MGRIFWTPVLALASFAQDLAKPDLAKEAALGRQLAAEAAQTTKPLDSAAVRDYVNQLGQRLAAKLPESAFPFTFAVVAAGADNPTHEPLVFPGGYVFVPASLFLAAQDGAEFAGVLARSMAHIAARHFTRLATLGRVNNQSAMPLIYIGGWTGQALPRSLLPMQRDHELEADRLAAEALAGAGIDPAALARYIGRVQPDGDAFSPLPARAERVRTIEAAVRSMPAQTYVVVAGFPAVQEEVRELLPQPTPPRHPSLRP
jgi:predicted Zn-dependent protease